MENLTSSCDRDQSSGLIGKSLKILLPILLIILGCAGIQPSHVAKERDNSNAANNTYNDLYVAESVAIDSGLSSPNLENAKYHFELAEQAIGDREAERVVDELDRTVAFLTAINQEEAEANPWRLIQFNIQTLESYRDILREVEVLSDEFAPERVLIGNEVYADSLADWLEWSDDDSDTAGVSLSENGTIMIFPPVPLVTNRKVNQVISYYKSRRGRKVFLKWMERGQLVLPRIQEILREEGVPEELAYLAMVESGLNPKAYSGAHASGPWQFIRSTGRLYGLYSDWWYDERRDMEKSTRAAAAYLKKLYLEFDDWYLAFAGYNCGELRVHRAIRRHHSRDFWKLWRLPRQTENYVPSYIAAALIMNDPPKYGFPEFKPIEPSPTETIWVSECVDFQVLANCANTDVNTLRTLNPPILRWCTPPTVDSIALILPQGKAERFLEAYAKIPKDQKTNWIRHRVRSGETLSGIARQYGSTISAIMDVPENKLRNKHRIPVGKYLLIPAPPGGITMADVASSSGTETVKDSRDGLMHMTYRVKKGDFLSKIADRYGVSIYRLREWNNLHGKRYIYPGQILSIWVPDDGSEPMASTVNSDGNTTHRVRSGENLWVIARRYGVKISEIQGANGMGRRTTINPGQVLIIPSPRSGG